MSQGRVWAKGKIGKGEEEKGEVERILLADEPMDTNVVVICNILPSQIIPFSPNLTTKFAILVGKLVYSLVSLA